MRADEPQYSIERTRAGDDEADHEWRDDARDVADAIEHTAAQAGHLSGGAPTRREIQSDGSSRASRRRTRRATVSLRLTAGVSSQLSTRFE